LTILAERVNLGIDGQLSRPMMDIHMEHPRHRATIAETPSRDNGYRYVVKTDDGSNHWLGRIAAPMRRLEAGTRGWLQFQQLSPSYADYVFTADDEAHE
jgi:hypothetical protein